MLVGLFLMSTFWIYMYLQGSSGWVEVEDEDEDE